MERTTPGFASEDAWDDLLAFIETGDVIPVVGPELLEVVDTGAPRPLYRAVGERLLAKYDPVVTVSLRPYQELNDAVCALISSGRRRAQDLYRPVNDILKGLLSGQAGEIPAPLRQLAEIARFDLFVTTTCDDLLVQAVNQVRYGGAPQTDEIEYAPRLSSDKLRDIPEIRPSGYSAVFYALGKASPRPQQYAIHDEDTLEFVYSLQTGAGPVPECMMGAIRSRNLLLIGCNFPDWLSRFVLRLSNQERLSERTKREFLADAAVSGDGSFTMFLERFSQNTQVFRGRAADFVSELGRRWRERHQDEAPRLPVAEPVRPAPLAGAIFVSYASADRPAAASLVESLKSIGGNVVWFDRHALAAGDDWKQRILEAVRGCRLFLPLLSASTERRREGFFRLEWDEAARRDRTIAGGRFIIPIIIDADYAGDPRRYALIPEGFAGKQFGHAPGGRPGEALRRALQEEIDALRRPPS